jgi:hypothetical protein
MVDLPAQKCPECNYVFVTGKVDDSEKIAMRRLVTRLALIFVIIVAVAIFVVGKYTDYRSAQRTQNAITIQQAAPKPEADLSDALESFQSLGDQPVGVRPKVILDTTQKAADQVNDNQDMAHDVFKAAD